MQKTINGEEVVRVQGTSAGIAPTETGYTLAYSFDGINFTEWEEPVPAGESLLLNGCVPGMLIKLVGNTANVEAMF